ncbi:MAG: M12 family metallo-peptidase, partial [Acidimicrobiia bacterium]|nr:M12 family metallo-peptidase [Acidimicrobiia bacterium]
MIRRLVLALAVVVVLMLGLAPAGGAQSDDPGAPAVTWTALDAIPDPPDASVDVAVAPERFQALSLDQASLITDLGGTPVEPSPGAAPAGGGSVISLPTPDGGFEDFEIVEAPVMEPDLAAQFPDIRTYGGQGLDDSAATVKIDVSDQGFHAQVLSPDGAWYIDPYYHLDTSVYVSYFKRDLSSPHAEFTEELVEDLGPIEGGEAPTANRSGTMLRTHRAVFAATGEYTTFHGGTVPQAQAAIVTAINRVNGIYEVEVAVRMVLVGDNANVVFTNSGTDPYCNCSNDIDTNQGVVDGAIGSVNYDVGHVFTTASGGVAGLGVVGVNGQKARGTTGTANPINDPFVVDFVAHEVGHQYGGNHPFNGNRGSCTGGNRNGPTAYEPGSGSTIQGYAGICGLDNLQLVGNGATGASDPYFHSISFDEIVAHTTGGSPGDIGATPTGNSVPTANAGANGVIPARTPFLLEGAGTDANGADVLTYNWEQRDLGQQRALDNPENSAGPLFRSFVATASNTRYLPKLSTIAAGNTNVTGGCGALTGAIGAPQACWSEFIPTVSRTMNFRLTVRDNRANGGGVNTDDVVVTVNDTGAPFAVTSQAAPVVYAGGSNQTVTWSVSGTSGGAINAPNVDIRLSTDGGNSFPTVVLADTPNDGTQAVTIPNVNTAQARIMVVESGAGQGVRFFNINAANFTIGGGGCVDNDDFGCAAVLGGPPASVNGSNVGFGVEGGEPSASCAFNGDPSQATA